MRHLRWSLVACMVLLAAACGPSAAEVKTARTARYTCDRKVVLKAVYEVIEAEQPPIAGVDVESGLVVSELRWHDYAGQRKKRGSAVVEDGDMMFGVAAQVVQRSDGWFVVVQPRVLLHMAGSPRGKEILKGDPEWPDWADGKANGVLIGIHKRLGACALH